MIMNQLPALSIYDIGEFSYCGPNFRVFDWNEGTTLKVGKFCSFAGDIKILLGGNHCTDIVTTYPFNVLMPGNEHCKIPSTIKGDVIIGNDVWIGTGATILSGITIGDGAVIGAESVVTKDVPSYSIYAGNPAKLIRYRFSKNIIDELTKLAWWNWDTSVILKYVPLLLSENINDFIKEAKKEI